LRSTAQKPDFAQAACLKERAITKNREGNPTNLRIRQRLLVRKRQGVRQMVKTRPEILEAVADKLQNQRWCRSEKLAANDIVVGFRIEFVGNSVWMTFDPSLNFGLEFLQVLFRPI